MIKFLKYLPAEQILSVQVAIHKNVKDVKCNDNHKDGNIIVMMIVNVKRTAEFVSDSSPVNGLI